MKRAVMALIALPILSGAAMAEQSDRAAFAPLATKAGVDAAMLDRVSGAQVAQSGKDRSQIRIQDVDANGDGKIGFDELMAFHKETDF